MLQQQGRFDAFLHRYNDDRPHPALAMQTPGFIYTPSRRPYQGLDYVFHDWTAVITGCGGICHQARKVNVSQVLLARRWP